MAVKHTETGVRLHARMRAEIVAVDEACPQPEGGTISLLGCEAPSIDARAGKDPIAARLNALRSRLPRRASFKLRICRLPSG